jgi:hypothetical protein
VSPRLRGRARRPARATSYEPRMGEDARRALLEQWRRALARARGWAAPDG